MQGIEALRYWVDLSAPTIGLIAALVSSLFIGCILKKVDIIPTPPLGISKKTLNDALLLQAKDRSVRWLGIFETIIFFYSFHHKDAAILGAGWLAFKVAAKWASWQHVVKLPEKNFFSPDPLENVRVRNQWASWLLSRFLLGTLYNVICGLIGATVTKLLIYLLR